MKTLVLCGGSGTRLWPISRTTCPKQFAPIINNKSLFEMTLDRNAKVSDEFIIVVNELQLKHCLSTLSKAYRSQIVIEPAARNTAPAIALACMELDPNEIVFVVPSDHLISANESYFKCIDQAHKLASEGSLVTFGITARYPETGYGYIEADGFDVLSFKEKPDLETASKYINAGNYFWNSGMFCFKAGVFLQELKNHCPELMNQLERVHGSKRVEDNQKYFDKELMLQVDSISIDYAVMEKSKQVKVVPSSIEWSDMGSFDSLYDELERDESGNTVYEKHVSFNSHNNLVLGNKRIIATFDVDDLIIVDTADAILIGKKGSAQNVKKIVEQLHSSYPEVLN